MTEHYPVLARMKCELVRNENGTFLVMENGEAYEAAALFSGWESISCFGQYENALKLSEPAEQISEQISI